MGPMQHEHMVPPHPSWIQKLEKPGLKMMVPAKDSALNGLEIVK